MSDDPTPGAAEDDSRPGLRQADLPTSRWFAYVELVRLPNVFTSVADVTMGYLFVRAAVAPGPLTPDDLLRLALLAVSSSLLYMAGVVLNDVFDYEVDCRERPERPLPSGRVAREAAAWLGAEMLLLGVAVAWLLAYLAGGWLPGGVAAALAGLIVLYDAWAKRTPLGPPAMGGCRTLNVLLGMSVPGAFWPGATWTGAEWLVAGAWGVYITGVTWFARSENRRSARGLLGAAMLVMMVGAVLPAALPLWPDRFVPLLRVEPFRWYLLVAVLAAMIGNRCLRAVLDPRPARVQSAVGHAIRSLIVLDAAVVFAVGGMRPAVAVLALLLPVVVLGQRIRAT